jgi:hypothetical protein
MENKKINKNKIIFILVIGLGFFVLQYFRLPENDQSGPAITYHINEVNEEFFLPPPPNIGDIIPVKCTGPECVFDIGTFLPPLPNPDYLDEFFTQKHRVLYGQNSEACNRVDDNSIDRNYLKYTHQGAKQLSDIVAELNLQTTQGRITCSSVFGGVSFSLRPEYDYREWFDLVFSIHDGTQPLVRISKYGFGNDEYIDIVEDREKHRKEEYKYDFKSDIFLLGDYGIGYYRQYTYEDYDELPHVGIEIILDLGLERPVLLSANIDNLEIKKEVFAVALSMFPIKRDQSISGFNFQENFLKYNSIDTSDWKEVRDEFIRLSYRIPGNWIVSDVSLKDRVSGDGYYMDNIEIRDVDGFIAETVTEDPNDPYELVSISAYNISIHDIVEKDQQYPFRHFNPDMWRYGQLGDLTVRYYINPQTKDTSFYLIYLGNENISYRIQSTLRNDPGVFEHILLSLKGLDSKDRNISR